GAGAAGDAAASRQVLVLSRQALSRKALSRKALWRKALSRKAPSRSSACSLMPSRATSPRAESAITNATMAMTGKASASSTSIQGASSIEAAQIDQRFYGRGAARERLKICRRLRIPWSVEVDEQFAEPLDIPCLRGFCGPGFEIFALHGLRDSRRAAEEATRL